MPTHCFAPVLGKRLRVTQVGEDGSVDKSNGEKVVTEGFISVTLSTEVEEGTEILQRNANGSICVNEKLSDSFKWFTIEAEFCGVSPDLLSLTTLAKPYTDAAGDTAGFTIGESELNKTFALELWTGISGDPSSFGYLLLPFVLGGALDEITIDGENAVNFNLTSAYTRGGNQWGAGPYSVVYGDTGTTPGPLPTPLDSADHMLIVDTAVAPPASACERSPISSGDGGGSGG